MAEMIAPLKTDDALWSKFSEEARRSRQNPSRLLAEFMSECLDRKEREKLNRKTIRAARKTGLTEEDDIESLVRSLRKKKFAKAQKTTSRRRGKTYERTDRIG